MQSLLALTTCDFEVQCIHLRAAHMCEFKNLCETSNQLIEYYSDVGMHHAKNSTEQEDLIPSNILSRYMYNVCTCMH